MARKRIYLVAFCGLHSPAEKIQKTIEKHEDLVNSYFTVGRHHEFKDIVKMDSDTYTLTTVIDYEADPNEQ